MTMDNLDVKKKRKLLMDNLDVKKKRKLLLATVMEMTRTHVQLVNTAIFNEQTIIPIVCQ